MPTVNLGKLYIDNSYKDCLYFSNRQAQTNFFSSMIKYSKTANQTVEQKRESTIRVELTNTQAQSVNYLWYYDEGKWWYYFIIDTEIINDRTVQLYLEEDVVNTYYFDITLDECFVERETVARDSVQYANITENLDTGEYRLGNYQRNDDIGDNWRMIVSDVEFREDEVVQVNGLARSVRLKGFDSFNRSIGVGNLPELATYLRDKVANGRVDEIIQVYQFPSSLCRRVGGTTDLEPITKSYTFSGYTLPSVRNKKCLGYPYHFIEVYNQNGETMLVRPELLQNINEFRYSVTPNIYENPTCWLTPLNYRGTTESRDERLLLSGFPQCAVQSDTYKAFVAQNSGSMMTGMAVGALTLGVGAVTGGVGLLTAGMSGAGMVASNVGAYMTAANQPNTVKGAVGQSGLVTQGEHTFRFQQKYAGNMKIIDNYFTRFGYKVNELKIPNFRNRQQYTYIKTLDFNASGVQGRIKEKWEQIFTEGVTFWTNHNNTGRYSVANPEL